MDAHDETRSTQRNCCDLFHAIDDGVCALRPVAAEDGQVRDFALVDTNRRFREVFGLCQEGPCDLLIGDVFGAPAAALREALLRVAAERKPGRVEIYLPRLDRYFIVSIAPLEREGVVAIFVDNTVHALAKAQLVRERAFNNALIDSIPGILYVYDSHNRLIRWNKLHEELTGFTADEMYLRNGFEWFDPDDLPAIARSQDNIRDRGDNIVRARIVCKSGERKPFLLTAARNPIQGEFHFLGIGIELTELERAERAAADLERQLVEAQKLESLGRLAGGIAHDFNNLLTVITGYAEMLTASQADPELRAYSLEIGDACLRAADLTRQLLAFGRKQICEPRPIDLNAILAGAERMLARLVGDSIALTLTLDPELGCILADPGQIHQVLLNLATNARDAMPDGGALVIETAAVESDEAYCAAHPEAPAGPCVLLSVADSGTGMPEEVRQRIFEPFFTTKEQGRGTGLGLASVYGIVRQSGGSIAVESEPGRGAIFQIRFPRSPEPATADALRPTPPARTTHNHETILLVEDQEALRCLNQRVLARAGFHVLTAGSAEEALEVASAHAGPIALLLADVMLPGRNGRELADRLLERRPGMKVLFCSAYSDDVIASRGVLRAGVSYLAKPFSSSALLHKIRDVLDA